MRKPLDVVWAYSLGSLGQYVYEPTNTGTGVIPTTGSVNFEISESQQTEVYIKNIKICWHNNKRSTNNTSSTTRTNARRS